MNIKFEKWQGLGNDFIILFDDIATSDIAIKMCERNFGVGADGLFCPTKSNVADIGWKFFNSDGTIAQMCGNGIRCFAKFAKKHNLVNKNKFSVETLAGIITPEILDNGNVLVDMGEPVLEAGAIPVVTNSPQEFKINEFIATAVSMGNPHCVIFTDSDYEKLAKGLSLKLTRCFPRKQTLNL